VDSLGDILNAQIFRGCKSQQFILPHRKILKTKLNMLSYSRVIACLCVIGSNSASSMTRGYNRDTNTSISSPGRCFFNLFRNSQLSTLYNAVKGRTEMTIGWASSWTDPPSPRPPWWVFWLVRPHKVSYKVSYNRKVSRQLMH